LGAKLFNCLISNKTMDFIQTKRLHLRPITPDDADFVLTLINSPGFLRFIGDRNVRTIEQSKEYIESLMANPDITYWVIILQQNKQSVGVVTWVKRDFLPVPDIGYALLPAFEGQGYAFEASQAWLTHQKQMNAKIVAICQEENETSIKLLKKLNFELEMAFEKNGKRMYQFVHLTPSN
jgi:ribosomal-protein-alanine N-acetyltransferase